MLLNDVIKEFWFDCQLRNISIRTMKNYRNINLAMIRFMENEYGIKDVEEVRSVHLKGFVNFQRSKGLSESYGNGIIKTFRAFFKYCTGEGYITENPSLRVNWIREPKVIINTFTDEEVIRMMSAYSFTDYLSARNRTILAMFFDTGIRNLELCMVEHIDIKDTYISIKGKGNKERHIGKSPQLEKHIIKYQRIKEGYFRDKLDRSDHFFLSRTGRPLTVEAVERILRMAGERAGVREEIRCSPHTCRHYYAQAQLKNGLDVYSLSRLLGHENIMITKRYLQSMQDRDIVSMSAKTSPLMKLIK